MKIIHRFTADEETVAKLESHGLNFQGIRRESWKDIWFSAYYVLNSDPRTELLFKLQKEYDFSILSHAEFTNEELQASSFLEVRSASITGFPQPQHDGSWETISFDATKLCKVCGAGQNQVAPIRMKAEPKWSKRKQTTQMHWINDQLFVSREIYDSLFSKFGIGFWPVQSTSGKITFDSVVQLKWQSLVQVEVPKRYKRFRCKSCEYERYEAHGVGFAPRVIQSDLHYVASDYSIGAGFEVYRHVYVSQELYQAMEAAKLNCDYAATPPQ